MTPIRVMIVDDEALVRHALRIFLEGAADMFVCGEAIDGLEATERAASLIPDVVLMDLHMPRLSGIDATQRIVASVPGVRVLALTTLSSERHVVSALRAGAAGYLVKDTEPEAILTAIREVHAGRSVISPRITMELINALRSEPQLSSTPVEALTDRELTIVRLLARGMSNAEIAASVHLAEPTVKAALSRIMTKWAVRDRVQVLIHAIVHRVVEVDRIAGQESTLDALR